MIILFYGYDIPCKIYNHKFNILSDKYFVDLNLCGYGYVALTNQQYRITTCKCRNNHLKEINCDETANVVSNGVCDNYLLMYTIEKELLLYVIDFSDKVVLKTDMIKSNIIQIRYGNGYGLFLSELGNVFGYGSNEEYQLTNQFTREVSIDNLTKINGLNNIKIICCGNRTSFSLDKNGILYSFGSNIAGLLGINKNCSEIKNDGNINQVIGYNFKIIHSVYLHIGSLSHNNNVYFWGYNKYGHCGTNNFMSQSKPYKINIPNINNDIIIDIKCGSFHSIIKTYNNTYYSFGYNAEKELLLNTNEKRIKIATKIDNEYIKNKTNNNNDIIDIIPGNNTSYILQMM